MEQQKHFTIIFSGRLTKEKGIIELIEAMTTISQIAHIRLIVLGSSFYGNDNNKNTFVERLQAKAAPIKKQISFTGFIPYDRVPDYLSMADVAVIPSVWDDPFPTTVLEAQAMGLPIITTRRGGIPEEVTSDNAILLDTDERFVSRLAEAIVDLYEHPDKRKRMSESAKAHSKQFGKDTYAKNFFAALT